MKNLLLLSLLFCCYGIANAQYFRTDIGASSANEISQRGITTTFGQVTIGSNLSGAISVGVTDFNGAAIPAFPSKEYIINRIGGVANLEPQDLAEINGKIYIVGFVRGTRIPFLVILNSTNGAVLSLKEYPLTIGTGNLDDVRINKSFAGDDFFYITGSHQNTFTPPFINGLFAIKIDISTLALVWNKTYQAVNQLTLVPYNCFAADAVESFYGGTKELVIAGRVIDFASGVGISKPMTFKIDAITGLPIAINPFYFYNIAGSMGARFNTIELSNNYSQGYVLSGNNNNNAIIANIDDIPTTINFWVEHDNTFFGVPAVNTCNSVKERLNTIGNYEYLMGGSVTNPFSGVLFGDIIKTQSNGLPLSDFVFVGMPNTAINSIDFNNSSSGLAAFTTNGAITTDLSIVKLYFNGFNQCVTIIVSNTFTLPTITPNFGTQTNITNFTPANLLFGPEVTIPLSEICPVATSSSGSNAKTIIKEEDIAISYNTYQNELSLFIENNTTIQTLLTPEITQLVEITIFDFVGKIIYTKTQLLEPGATKQLQINLEDNYLSTGMYAVYTTIAGHTFKTKLMVN